MFMGWGILIYDKRNKIAITIKRTQKEEVYRGFGVDGQ